MSTSRVVEPLTKIEEKKSEAGLSTTAQGTPSSSRASQRPSTSKHPKKKKAKVDSVALCRTSSELLLPTTAPNPSIAPQINPKDDLELIEPFTYETCPLGGELKMPTVERDASLLLSEAIEREYRRAESCPSPQLCSFVYEAPLMERPSSVNSGPHEAQVVENPEVAIVEHPLLIIPEEHSKRITEVASMKFDP